MSSIGKFYDDHYVATHSALYLLVGGLVAVSALSLTGTGVFARLSEMERVAIGLGGAVSLGTITFAANSVAFCLKAISKHCNDSVPFTPSQSNVSQFREFHDKYPGIIREQESGSSSNEQVHNLFQQMHMDFAPQQQKARKE